MPILKLWDEVMVSLLEVVKAKRRWDDCVLVPKLKRVVVARLRMPRNLETDKLRSYLMFLSLYLLAAVIVTQPHLQ